MLKCYAPWHALSIRFNGDVAPDCVYTGRFGNILTDPLPKILSSIGLEKTRNDIKNGILPPDCSSCIQKEHHNNNSRRVFFQHHLNPMVPDFDNPQSDIYFLEFNMSNVCNLKCRMCCGINSTAWIKEDIKLVEKYKIFRPITDKEFGYTNVPATIVDNLFKYPEYFKNLQYVNIKGGEPYLEPANKKIMKYLIDMGIAKNITLDIGTNGTIVDKEFDNLALQFKKTIWHVSIEGIGEMYNYIRGGGNFTFEQLEDNLKEFAKFDRVILAGTVTPYNVCHLNKVRDWFETVKQDNFELFFTNMVVTPSYLNPCVLPDYILEGTGYKHDPALDGDLQMFIDYTKALDEIRGTNVLDVCPELDTLFT